MRQIKVLIGGKEHAFTGPSSWNEVDSKMALKLFTLSKATLSSKHLAFALPMLIYDIPKSIIDIFADPATAKRRFLAATDDEDPETLALLGEELINTCSWVYTDNPPSRWLLPSVELLTGRYHNACADRLHDLTFGEFVFAESFAISDPAKLCALIYQKRSFFGKGKRQRVDHKDVDRFAQVWQQEKFNTVRQLIVWNYTGMMLHLKSVFPHVFNAPSDSTETAAAPSATPWLDAAFALADNDVTKFRAYEADELYLALKMLSNRIVQNKEIQKKYEK